MSSVLGAAETVAVGVSDDDEDNPSGSSGMVSAIAEPCGGKYSCFLLAELGVEGTLDGNGRLLVKGKFY